MHAKRVSVDVSVAAGAPHNVQEGEARRKYSGIWHVACLDRHS